jgi:para-nitrobenzyl esterase
MNRRSFLGAGAAGMLVGGAFTRVALAAAVKTDSSGGGPVVETTSGKIRGAIQSKVFTFKGVPYGASTAGANRFMPPQKPQPWAGVRDALEIGLRSPQPPSNIVAEWAVLDRTEPAGEDCLVLNVWSPALDGKKRPVMFWLHGGGFTGGSDGFLAYDGTELERDRHQSPPEYLRAHVSGRPGRRGIRAGEQRRHAGLRGGSRMGPRQRRELRRRPE